MISNFDASLCQVAAETFLNNIPGLSSAVVAPEYLPANLMRQLIVGNEVTTKLTATEAAEFVQKFQVLYHQPNDATGLSFTVLGCLDLEGRLTGEKVLSIRSTECDPVTASGALFRDRADIAADAQLAFNGYAYYQLAALEKAWPTVIAGLATAGIPDGPLNVTGYSLAGNIATGFTQLEAAKGASIASLTLFNAAGIGQVAQPVLKAVVAELGAALTPDLLNADILSSHLYNNETLKAILTKYDSDLHGALWSTSLSNTVGASAQMVPFPTSDASSVQIPVSNLTGWDGLNMTAALGLRVGDPAPIAIDDLGPIVQDETRVSNYLKSEWESRDNSVKDALWYSLIDILGPGHSLVRLMDGLDLQNTLIQLARNLSTPETANAFVKGAPVAATRVEDLTNNLVRVLAPSLRTANLGDLHAKLNAITSAIRQLDTKADLTLLNRMGLSQLQGGSITNEAYRYALSHPQDILMVEPVSSSHALYANRYLGTDLQWQQAAYRLDRTLLFAGQQPTSGAAQNFFAANYAGISSLVIRDDQLNAQDTYAQETPGVTSVKVIFAKAAEAVQGDMLADHLYGALNSTLNGNAGDDLLVSGGHNQLKGGAGTDIYVVSNGDTIDDSDLRGYIQMEGTVLTGGEWNSTLKCWTTADGTAYQRIRNTDLRVTLGKTMIEVNGYFLQPPTGLGITLTGHDGTHVQDLDLGDEAFTQGLTHALTTAVQCGTIIGKGFFYTGYWPYGSLVQFPIFAKDPLALDLNNDGHVATTNLSGHTYFDYTGNGFAQKTSWIAPEDGLLVRDINQNGSIDSGRELFGDQTQLPSGSLATDAYQALAALDINQDGVVSADDVAWSELAVWQDFNGDGTASSNELSSLADRGIAALQVSASPVTTTDNGNQQTAVSTLTRADGTQGVTAAFTLRSSTADTQSTIPVTVPDSIQALPSVRGYGLVRSLQQAMALDPTLETLVRDLASSPASAGLDAQFDQLIYRWVGADAVAPTSRGDYLDARQLAAVETFAGTPYVSALTGSTSPGSDTAAVLQSAYDALHARVKSEFLMDSQLAPYWDAVAFAWDPARQTFAPDFSATPVVLPNQPANAQIELLYQFVQGVKAQGIAADESFTAWAARAGAAAGTHWAAIQAGLAEPRLLAGSAAADTVTVTDQQRVGFGFSGDDLFQDATSGSNSATFVGGPGDDAIVAGSSDSTFVFGNGDGHDTVSDAGGTDTVRFEAGVRSAEVQLVQQGQDLQVQLADGSALRVNQWFDDSLAHILEYFVFPDGTQWTPEFLWANVPNKAQGTSGADLLYGLQHFRNELNGGSGTDTLYGGMFDDALRGGASNDILKGFDGNDQLYGEGDQDTLYSGAGNDLLDGGAGDDLIVIDGVGNKTVAGGAGIDHLMFATDAANYTPWPGQAMSFANNRVAGQGYSVSFTGIEILKFSDGDYNVTVDLATCPDIKTLYMGNGLNTVHLMNGTVNSVNGASFIDNFVLDNVIGTNLTGSTISGGWANDTYDITGLTQVSLYDSKGTDRLVFDDVDSWAQLAYEVSTNGLTTVRATTGASVFLNGGNVVEQVAAGAGSDLSWADFKAAAVQLYGGVAQQSGTAGADTLTGAVFWANALSGGAGDDTLTGGNQADTLDGGLGNDVLFGGLNDDIYRFESGGGHDTVSDSGGQDLMDMSWLAGDQAQFWRQGNDLLVEAGAATSVLVKNQFLLSTAIEQFKFQDGTRTASQVNDLALFKV